MRYRNYKKPPEMDLETVLTREYSAAAIIHIYDQLYPGVAAAVAKKGGKTPVLTVPSDKKLIKRDRIAVLLQLFTSKQLCKLWYEQLPEMIRAVVEATAWYGRQMIVPLEKQLGTKFVDRNPAKNSYYQPFLLREGYSLLCVGQEESSFSREPGRDKFYVYMPRALRSSLRKTLPKPAAYTLTLSAKRAKTEFSHCSESSALTKLIRMAEFIDQGHLAVKKNGDPSVKGLRDIGQVAGLSEFYPAVLSKELARIKVSMLVGFFLACDWKKSALKSTPHIFLRNLVSQWGDSDYLLLEQLLTHIRVDKRNYYYDLYAPENIKKDLLKILKNLQTDSWASMESVVNYCQLRQINLLEKKQQGFDFETVETTSYGSWRTRNYVSDSLLVPVVYQPLLQGFFFLAAALGLAEIAYDEPVNEILHKPGYPYLSEYEGLKYVRLTELGSFVCGKTRKYSATTSVQAKAVFNLDTKRLYLTVDGDDPVARLTLEKMLEPVGTDRFRMTFASLFRACQSKADVKKKAALFRKTICKKPPRIWQQFFRTAEKRVNPLIREPDYIVFKIEADDELLQLLATAPDIAPLIVKVEGLRIAVDKKNSRKLINGLKKHGYLITGKAMSA